MIIIIIKNKINTNIDKNNEKFWLDEEKYDDNEHREWKWSFEGSSTRCC